MHKKQALISSIVLLLLIAGTALSMLAYTNLQPSAKADADLPRIDVSTIKPNSWVIYPHPVAFEYYNGFTAAILFVRLNNGHLFAWHIATRNGSVGLPDIHWWRPEFPCKNFGPVLRDDKIDEAAGMACYEMEDAPIWGDYVKRWRWSISGKALTPDHLDDMQAVTGVLEGKYFVVGKVL